MASWMIHLRVAQGIYEKLNLVHKYEFENHDFTSGYCPS